MLAEQSRVLFVVVLVCAVEDVCEYVCVENCHVLCFLNQVCASKLNMFGRRFMWCAGMCNKSAAVIYVRDVSKFFGPSPRKHRLTVYRGFQVLALVLLTILYVLHKIL